MRSRVCLSLFSEMKRKHEEAVEREDVEVVGQVVVTTNLLRKLEDVELDVAHTNLVILTMISSRRDYCNNEQRMLS